MRAFPIMAAVIAFTGLTAAATRPQGPRELGYMRVPEQNPLTEAGVRLGRRLFFDTRLSGNGTVSCASCHLPERAFADNRRVAVGIDGRRGHRNVPALTNRGYGESFFWDGRAPTLEAQVLEPIDNPDELGTSVTEVVDRLAQAPEYIEGFDAAFGPASIDDMHLARALASYVRSIRSADSRVDRYRAGDRTALTREEQLGMRVFGNRGLCTTCHKGPTFTDELFHNTGVAWDAATRTFTDEGRFAVTEEARDRGAFRTPSLRDVSKTAPYMHDGSFATLEAVVDFYDAGGRTNPALDSEMLRLDLSRDERAALAAFLRALDGTLVEGPGALTSR